MNKEVEEALKKVLDYAVSPQYENVLILKQAFSDMEKERKQRDETEQSLSEWVVELQSKLDKVRKLAKSKILRRNEDNTIYGTQYITVEEIEKLLEEDLRLEQILKEETKCINGK